jgi:hypothetical protein
MRRELAALSWAKKLYGDESTIFKYLEVGEYFYFPPSNKKMQKVSKNRYVVCSEDRKWSTGVYTVVSRIQHDTNSSIYQVKNCPCCGRKPIIVGTYSHNEQGVVCSCGLRMKVEEQSLPHEEIPEMEKRCLLLAIAKWNKRIVG